MFSATIFDDCQIETVYTCLAFCLFLRTALSNCFSVFANYYCYLCSACWKPIAIGKKLIKISMSQQSSQSLCLCDLLLLLFAKRAFEVALLATMHLAMLFFPLSVSLSLSFSHSQSSRRLVSGVVECPVRVARAERRFAVPLQCHKSVTSTCGTHRFSPHHLNTSSLYWTRMCLGAWYHTSVGHTYTTHTHLSFQSQT